MYIVHTTIPVDSEHEDRLQERIDDLVERSRNEDGTVRYRAMRDLSDPGLIRFFEQYETAEAAERHTESAAYRRFNEMLPEVANGDIETVQFETADVHTVEFSPSEAVSALD
jgi:Uncharacterized conserved protein